ncbi:AI-2E family transporter [Catellicoccus marimammalium]|uniref:UPF0118 membrane protein YrrI n=1 Tax=Catellicoccus marimammalium M35/04/3 TaxID=1234409 RepID=K8ZM54_9ENTE|nr:AI-2E family transporter [Catellicoccus marimammalium]EKU27588.1 UPF0118 membrane protein YrrI [Catellicoccus marimammalium M35/04/3]
MFEKFNKSNLLFWSLELLILASLIFVSTKIKFLFQPISAFCSTLFAPLLLAGFLYYITNPLVTLLERFKIKRIIGIAIVFLLLIGIISLSVSTFIPSLIAQLVDLSKNIPSVMGDLQDFFAKISHEPWMKELNIDQYLHKFDISIAKTIKGLLVTISSGLGNLLSSLTSMVMMMITVPFILFYMLKDGHKMIPGIRKHLPKSIRDDIANLLHKMSDTLSSYISGQAMECVFVALCTFVGYELIGIPYAFLLAVIAGLTNMVPYLGPYLGLAPAMFVTVFHSPWKAVLCAVVVLIVQQIDGNIIYPNVIGKSLDIHPLTIIIILLVAGNIAGVLGMILGVPFYAIVKVIVKSFLQIYRIHKQQQREDALVKGINGEE